MPSKPQNREAFVWIWLPGETQPVVAGKLETDNGSCRFNYGKSYLDRTDGKNPAIPIYEPELPLRAGVLPLLNNLEIPNCIRDAAPDAWGRRVIINRQFGRKGRDVDTGSLDELTYLLKSGSDRIGALDFQRSPTEFVARNPTNASLEELLESAERVEQGVPLSAELDQALFHGTSIGGARPKAMIEDRGTKYIAKFSSGSDIYNVVKAEYVAMRLATIAGLKAAPVKLAKAAGKDVLLIERFDRIALDSGWARKSMVSALTMLGLSEMTARYASYEDLAESIRHRFTQPRETLAELYGRLVFNILCGNNDDHARNHAAFWDGKELTLTPAYDICPQGRTGNEATQAMLITGDNRFSQLKTCLAAAHHFLLSRQAALDTIDRIETAIRDNWERVCGEAELSQVDKNYLWGHQFLNPFSVER